MTERDLFDAIGRLPERFRTEAMEPPANTADKTAVIQAGSAEALHNTDAAIRQHKTENLFSGKLRYLAVLASAAACIAGVVGIVHMHRGSDTDSFVAESVITDVREEAPETETEPVQTTVTSEAKEILTVRTTEKAVTTAKAVTTGKQQGSTAQQTGTTAAAAVQNSRTTAQATAQQTTAATAQRTTAAPRQTTTVRTTVTTQRTTTTAPTTTTASIVYTNSYPGPNYRIVVRPVAYFSDDAAQLTDAEMTALNMQGEAEIQYLSEIRVTSGDLVDPSTGAVLPEGGPAYSIRGASGGSYFESADLNSDTPLFIHNYSDERDPSDTYSFNSIGFMTFGRNIVHVWNQPDERDTEIKMRSENKVVFYMFARPDEVSGPVHNTVDTLQSNYYRTEYDPYFMIPAGIADLSDSIHWDGEPYFSCTENPDGSGYIYDETAKATFYDTTVIEYNVLTGTMQICAQLKPGEPIPNHPMPN